MSKANAEADREQEEEEAACAEPQQLGGGREAEEVQGRGCGGMSWHLIYLPENLA